MQLLLLMLELLVDDVGHLRGRRRFVRRRADTHITPVGAVCRDRSKCRMKFGGWRPLGELPKVMSVQLNPNAALRPLRSILVAQVILNVTWDGGYLISYSFDARSFLTAHT